MSAPAAAPAIPAPTASPPADEAAWPRLRPLVLAALRSDLQAPTLAADRPEPPRDWTALLGPMRRDLAQGPALLRALAWGLGDDDLLWWALLAARFEEALADRPRPSRALAYAERWLRERDETIRYQIFALAQAEPPGPGALAGYAAFASGPSLTPADEKPQPPPPGMARGAAQGVLLAAAAAPAMVASDHGFDVVNLIGLEVAAGRDGRAAARRALSAIAERREEATA